MSESIFASIIDEMAERDLARYAGMPTFRTSKKHDRTMQRIFKRYERNTRKLRPHYEIRIRTIRRRITVALLVIILAVITGFTAAYFITQGFRGDVHSDNTELFPISTENCPTVIEKKYYLPELPEGFEEDISDSNPYHWFITYENEQTGQTITFEQWTKSELGSTHYSADKGDWVEVEINGHYGLLLETSRNNKKGTYIIWDNGDYIIQLSGDLPKNELLDLAKSAKNSE